MNGSDNSFSGAPGFPPEQAYKSGPGVGGGLQAPNFSTPGQAPQGGGNDIMAQIQALVASGRVSPEQAKMMIAKMSGQTPPGPPQIQAPEFSIPKM